VQGQQTCSYNTAQNNSIMACLRTDAGLVPRIIHRTTQLSKRWRSGGHGGRCCVLGPHDLVGCAECLWARVYVGVVCGVRACALRQMWGKGRGVNSH
jgi:hypothetical protein